MNPRASQYIQTLAQFGSITRAAGHLYITPSALSRYISTVEKEVGTQLFSRIGNHFVLTYAGERYVEWCRQYDALSRQMQDEMDDLAKKNIGKIRIGVQTTLSDLLICHVMPKFVTQYPNICVCITEDTSTRIMEQVRQYQLDAAISTRVPDSDLYYTEELVRMEHVLLLRKDHPLVEMAVDKPGFCRRWIDLDWCRNERFIAMHPGQNPRKDIEQSMSSVWNDLNIAMEVRSMRSIIEAVSNGLGIAAVSSGINLLYADHWDNLVSLSYGEEPYIMSYYLFHYKDIYMGVPLRCFLELTKQQLKARITADTHDLI